MWLPALRDVVPPVLRDCKNVSEGTYTAPACMMARAAIIHSNERSIQIAAAPPSCKPDPTRKRAKRLDCSTSCL